MDQQIGHCVRRGGLLVDDNKVLPAEVAQQTRRRVDGQACAADDEGVGPADGVHGVFHRLLVQPLLVEHNIGLDDAAALVAAGHAVADARRILAGQEPTADSANRVTDVPQGFKQWLKDNEERAKCAESLPYFMKNNPSVLKEHTPEIHNILVKRAISNAKSVASDFQRQVEVIARKFDAIVTPVNLKSVESTVRKINEDSDNHIGSIRDLVRNTIIVEDADRIGHIVEEIQKRFIVPLGEKGKPRIKSQNTPLGYTGTLVNVQLKGVQGEIQINIPQMIYAKDESAKELLPKDLFDKIKRESGLECGHGHKYYEEWRLPTTSSARKRELEKLSQAYYKAIRKVKL